MNKSSGRLLADGRLPALIDSGQVQVYIAKYNYDPFQFSPNENPEAELPLNSGDYVFINGEMDEVSLFNFYHDYKKIKCFAVFPLTLDADPYQHLNIGCRRKFKFLNSPVIFPWLFVVIFVCI